MLNLGVCHFYNIIWRIGINFINLWQLTNVRRSMRKLMQLMHMTAILMLFAGCGHTTDDSDLWLNVRPAETWELTYSDYHVLWNREQAEFPKYRRMVGIIRDRDCMYIQGIFPKYPTAWIKGIIEGNTVYFEDGQMLGGSEYAPMYFHFGTAGYTYYYSYGNHSLDEWIAFRSSSQTKLSISAGGNLITAEDRGSGPSVAFWYNPRVYGSTSLYDKGLKPDKSDVNYMVNVEFRKISDAEENNIWENR